MADCGLHVNQKWPFLGASPDEQVFCECCGKGLCEIKCPYKYKDTTLGIAAKDSSFWPSCNENGGGLNLDMGHPYYYQVQCQLFVTGLENCDFVVWTEKDLFIQRVLPDTEFWKRVFPKVILFYKKGVLPELLGRWFTRLSALPQPTASPVTDSDEDVVWCYCKQFIEESQLIGCDKPDCEIQWFHMSCVGLRTEPEGEWFCPSCAPWNWYPKLFSSCIYLLWYLLITTRTFFKLHIQKMLTTTLATFGIFIVGWRYY